MKKYMYEFIKILSINLWLKIVLRFIGMLSNSGRFEAVYKVEIAVVNPVKKINIIIPNSQSCKKFIATASPFGKF